MLMTAVVQRNRHRMVGREQACSLNMRGNTPWRHLGCGTVEGYGDIQRPDKHRGRKNERRNERYHENPRWIDRCRKRLELTPALTNRRIDEANLVLDAGLVT